MPHLFHFLHLGLVSLQHRLQVGLLSLQQLVVAIEPRSLLLHLLPLLGVILIAQIIGGSDASVVVTNAWQWWRQRHQT